MKLLWPAAGCLERIQTSRQTPFPPSPSAGQPHHPTSHPSPAIIAFSTIPQNSEIHAKYNILTFNGGHDTRGLLLQACNCAESGIVAAQLGLDRKPVYAPINGANPCRFPLCRDSSQFTCVIEIGRRWTNLDSMHLQYIVVRLSDTFLEHPCVSLFPDHTIDTSFIPIS